jgi:hypothetical protein
VAFCWGAAARKFHCHPAFLWRKGKGNTHPTLPTEHRGFHIKGILMKKIIFGVAAVALLGLTTLTGTAEAHVRGGHHGGYYSHHGVRFSGGYSYHGFNHHHWGRRVWDPVRCRWNYWDPYLQVYYYWYAPGNCFYPVTYCP